MNTFKEDYKKVKNSKTIDELKIIADKYKMEYDVKFLKFFDFFKCLLINTIELKEFEEKYCKHIIEELRKQKVDEKDVNIIVDFLRAYFYYEPEELLKMNGKEFATQLINDLDYIKRPTCK